AEERAREPAAHALLAAAGAAAGAFRPHLSAARAGTSPGRSGGADAGVRDWEPPHAGGECRLPGYRIQRNRFEQPARGMTATDALVYRGVPVRRMGDFQMKEGMNASSTVGTGCFRPERRGCVRGRRESGCDRKVDVRIGWLWPRLDGLR